MFAGHVGAGMAIGRVERRINVGTFIFAAMLLDAVLWFLVLVGLESVTIPPDFASTHQPEFVFPYSHGLLGSLGWSALAGAVAFRWYPGLDAEKRRAAALIGIAVLSRWLLDALVHAPELPLAGTRSQRFGLGLWQDMPVALTVEAVILVGGLCFFLQGSKLSQANRTGLTLLSLLILAFTIVGMTVAPPPPSVPAMALSSLATIIAVGALACWLGRRAT